jgi:hypothetical protein
MANIYNKAGLVAIPAPYKDGFLYNIRPDDDTLAFKFDRGSSATFVDKDGLIKTSGLQTTNLVQNGDFSQEGPELVTNGDFSTDSNWSIVGTSVISNGKYKASGLTAYGFITSQSPFSATSGKTYKVVFEVSDYVQGAVRPRVYGGSGVSVSSNGVHTQYVQAGNSDTVFAFLAWSGDAFIGSIDNVSVVEVGQNWSTQSDVTFGDGIVSMDSTSLNAYINQNALVVGKTYKISITVDALSINNNLDLINSNGITYQVLSTGVNIFEITANQTAFRIRTKNGATSTISNVSIQEVQEEIPRIDYTDSLTSPALLIEPQSTNLITYSNNFSYWSEASGASVDYNVAISPDGTQNASRFNFDGTSNGRVERNTSGLSSGIEYTFSVWMRSESGIVENVQIGHVSFGLLSVTVTEQWQRFETTNLSDRTNAYPRVRLDTANSVLVYGYQLEPSSFATSYIPTTGTAATRLAETCVGAGSASTFNSTEGVLYAEIGALSGSIGQSQIELGDGSDSTQIKLGWNSDRVLTSIQLNNTSVLNFQYNTGSDLLEQEYYKVAVKYKSGQSSVFIDGVEVATSSTTYTNTDTISQLGFQLWWGGTPFYGKTKGVYVFNEALSDDELQQLTGPEYNTFAALAAASNYTIQ